MNSTKPRMRKSKVVRKNRSDTSRVITIPVSFDLEGDMRIGVDDTFDWSFDVVSLLAKSNVFGSLSHAYDRFRIKRVHGCIDLNTVPKFEIKTNDILHFYRSGSDLSVDGKYIFYSKADYENRFRNPILCCAFDRRCTVEDEVDPFSYGSCIFQAKLPGTGIHLSPDVVASTLQERMSFIPTSVLSRYRNFAEKNPNQIVFDPTFHVCYKQLVSGNKITYSEFGSGKVQQVTGALQNTDVLAFVHSIKLHCMFYVDVMFDGIRDVVDEDVSDTQLFGLNVGGSVFKFIPLGSLDDAEEFSDGNYKLRFGGSYLLAPYVISFYNRPRGFAVMYSKAELIENAPDFVAVVGSWSTQTSAPKVSLTIAGLDEAVPLEYQKEAGDNTDYGTVKDLPQYYLDTVTGYLN